MDAHLDEIEKTLLNADSLIIGQVFREEIAAEYIILSNEQVATLVSYIKQARRGYVE
jgi:hypothetical protein